MQKVMPTTALESEICQGTETLHEKKRQKMEKVAPNTPRTALVDLSLVVISQGSEIPHERERSDKYLHLRAPLYQAALKGDWQAAKVLLEKYPNAVRVPVTKWKETALHIAAVARRTAFVKKLVKWMTPSDLEFENIKGNTALCSAALSGALTIAEVLVKMNNKLLLIRSKSGKIPLHIAALYGRRSLVSYLFSVTPFEELAHGERVDLLIATINTDMYDIAVKILEKDQTLAIAQDKHGKIALQELARKPGAIGSKSQLSVWQRCISYWFKEFYDKALMRTFAHQLVEGLWKEILKLPERKFYELVDNHLNLIFEAAEIGNAEFLVILIRSTPDLVRALKKRGMTLFHAAVLHRQENVFSLIYELGAMRDIIAGFLDEKNNNMLHLVGQLAPPDRLNIISGAALQMQRELLWFKEIEKILPPPRANMKNSDGQTPRDLFTKAHQGLQEAGEKWMKDTSNSFMIVATLIATVVFAAAFTLPGGDNQQTGPPVFLGSNWFMVFFISDAIAFISSTTSISIFLSILTSRYTENDFLQSLPARLTSGFAALFISIVGMVIAFTATCFLICESKMTKVPTLIIVSFAVPVILFIWLHYDLWVDVIRSAYHSRSLFRRHRSRLI